MRDRSRNGEIASSTGHRRALSRVVGLAALLTLGNFARQERNGGDTVTTAPARGAPDHNRWPPMESWRTAIANSDETNIWIRGYDIASLMRRASFADLFFLLHRSRLPRAPERTLMEAMLIAVADHGAGAPSCAAARL